MRSWGPVDLSKDGKLIARKARVLHGGGFLYLALNSSTVTRIAADTPEQDGKKWTAGDYSWIKNGCSTCSWTLGRISTTKLIAQATEAT